MDISSILSYLTFFLINAGIYAIVCLGLNIQWGYTGLFNVGIAGFYCIGAYASALVTLSPPDVEAAQYTSQLFGLNLPFCFGIIAAMVCSGVVALGVGALTLKLKGDYLAIATIGIAETIRLIFLNEKWLANGSNGLPGVPRPLAKSFSNVNYDYFYLILVICFLLLIFFLIERSIRSPWGRVLRAIREDETSAAMSGKNIVGFKMQAFVFGAMIMGLGGALKVHYLMTVSPQMFIPLEGTFFFWVMVIVGGSGNNKGVILGAVVVWGIFTFSQFITDLNLPHTIISRAPYIRYLLIGIVLEVILVTRPEGILGEEKTVSRHA